MLRKAGVFLFLIFVTLPVFSAESYFATYSAAYNINLADPNNIFTGAQDRDDIEYGDPGYNSTTLIAYAGINNTTAPVDVTIEWYTTPWMYQSASQPNLKRPFGIDFVLRNRWHWEERIFGIVLAEGNEDLTGANPSHFGNQDDSNTDDVDFNFSDRTDGTLEKSGQDLGFDMWGESEKYWKDYKLISSWVDIVLVLPKIDSNNTSYQVGSADDYYASFDIVFSGGVEMRYHCEINGYYETEEPESMDLTLNVIPNANASSINLDDTSGDIAPGSGTGLNIGTYSYTTTYEGSDSSIRYYAFVSSSPNPDTQGDPFRLVQVDGDDSELNEHNSIAYEVRLKSNQTTGRTGDVFSTWFDGTTSITGIEEGSLSGVFFDSVYMAMHREGETDDDGNSVTTYLHYDNGNILFRLANGANPDVLNAGVYNSYIYFHVISQQ